MSEEINIDTPLKSIKGVPPGTAKKLEQAGIKTASDILWHFPVRYEDWSNPIPIKDIYPGQNVVIKAKVGKFFTKRIWQKKLSITQAELIGKTGKIKATWFNQPYIKYSFNVSDEIFASGKVTEQKGQLILLNPTYEVVGKKTKGRIGSIVPIYARPKGVSSAMMQRVASKVISLAEKMPEFIPEKILEKQHIPHISQSVAKAHLPSSIQEGAEAKKRFSFETLFLIQLLNRINKKQLLEMGAPKIKFDVEEVKDILLSLPFELTFSQKRSLYEILQDISSGKPMNRLLQGDVGSGKTVVAAIAAIITAKSNLQSAIMAPTEILASQHYSTIKKMFGKRNIRLGLMTANSAKIFMGEGLESEVKRSEISKMISEKKLDIIIGTHSLIAKRKLASPKSGNNSLFNPENIGLVVVDEQHRFGVKERSALTKNSSKKAPHFLSMSATPIPRTMAIALFGDLDISLIEELPKGRKKIATKWVSPQNRNKAYKFIEEKINEGRQAFIICPKIETVSDPEEIAILSSWSDVKNVKEEFERLSSKIFPEIKMGMLHGKMPAKEKEKTMLSFKEGKISILVCTSVVEVGIDIPNASIMVIEDADRFGLAQLYQFKGRVGRGEHQSFCLLFSKSSSDIARNRLQALAEAKNGLELAEKDLLLRGPGELLGQSQKGLPDITMKALQDKALIKASREAADMVLEEGLKLEEFGPLKKKLDSLRDQFHLE
ncbi:MAG: ATP-dependent DNA helicase RecG [Candidatus Colwellbacteria bacterium]|jgi:ATP-dependent DNA helicase RecG|nr:ATP-dependent DNA helicase RecG [Candidatus Colwellbacteria bacterium]MCK9497677.1 ATP-dependent DNA helicase RecG [Candidatus Colwellbacteria bacterium]